MGSEEKRLKRGARERERASERARARERESERERERARERETGKKGIVRHDSVTYFLHCHASCDPQLAGLHNPLNLLTKQPEGKFPPKNCWKLCSVFSLALASTNE